MQGFDAQYFLHREINKQKSYPVKMPAKEEHGCDSGSESIDKHEPRSILECHVERRDQRRV